MGVLRPCQDVSLAGAGRAQSYGPAAAQQLSSTADLLHVVPPVSLIRGGLGKGRLSV